MAFFVPITIQYITLNIAYSKIGYCDILSPYELFFEFFCLKNIRVVKNINKILISTV